jgi:sigma-B regulation protein RsbU (phosphoserine phosphatase)
MDVFTDEAVRIELEGRRERLAFAVGRGGETARLRALLAEVDDALTRMTAGTYGLCEVCGDAIEHARLMAEPLARTCLDHMSSSEQRALEQDLDLAVRIQAQMLPQRELAVAGWEVAYRFEPKGPVGGDYCDVILGDGAPGTASDALFLLGDVSGKGVPASILMANLHATFRSLADVGLPVEALMARANRLFCRSTLDAHYATLVLARATPQGEVDIVNAGHLPALIVRKDGVQPVGATGIPLGLFCNAEYGHERVAFAPGDLMVLHTDGLSEARDAGGEEYGGARLPARLAELAAAGEGDPHRVLAACLEDLTRFRAGAPLDDDLTVMVVRRS